jgi:hypothetical protein
MRTDIYPDWGPSPEQPLQPQYNLTRAAQTVGERAVYGMDIPTPYADQALAELEAFNRPIVEAAMGGMVDTVIDKITTYHEWSEVDRGASGLQEYSNQIDNIPDTPWVSNLNADMTLFDPMTRSFTSVNAKYAYAGSESCIVVRDKTPRQDKTPFQTERRNTPGYERSYRIDMKEFKIVSRYDTSKEQVINPVFVEQWSTIIARSIPVNKDILALANKLANAENPRIRLPGEMVHSIGLSRPSIDERLEMKRELSEMLAEAQVHASHVRAESQVQLSVAKPALKLKK